jgi:hypothetical protein
LHGLALGLQAWLVSHYLFSQERRDYIWPTLRHRAATRRTWSLGNEDF